MSTMLIQSGTLDDIADAIRAKTGGSASMTPLQMPTQIASIPSGGGGINLLSGNAPLTNLGNDGDMFLQYPPKGIRGGNGNSYCNTEYNGNDDSEYVLEFMETRNQTTVDSTIFGGQPDASVYTDAVGVQIKNSSSNHIISVLWGASAIQAFTIPNTEILNKFVRLELKAGLLKMTIDGVERTFTFTPTSISSATNIFVLAKGVNNSVYNNSRTQDVWIYKFEIKENGNTVRRFVPYKVNNYTMQLYDEILDEYKNVTNPAVWSDGGIISNTYQKINGVWTNVVGTNIDDIITS